MGTTHAKIGRNWNELWTLAESLSAGQTEPVNITFRPTGSANELERWWLIVTIPTSSKAVTFRSKNSTPSGAVSGVLAKIKDAMRLTAPPEQV